MYVASFVAWHMPLVWKKALLLGLAVKIYGERIIIEQAA